MREVVVASDADLRAMFANCKRGEVKCSRRTLKAQGEALQGEMEDVGVDMEEQKKKNNQASVLKHQIRKETLRDWTLFLKRDRRLSTST